MARPFRFERFSPGKALLGRWTCGQLRSKEICWCRQILYVKMILSTTPPNMAISRQKF
jgi:hypothetical protein